MNLTELNIDVLLKIIKWLPSEDLTKLSAVNKRLNEITSSDIIWKERCFDFVYPLLWPYKRKSQVVKEIPEKCKTESFKSYYGQLTQIIEVPFNPKIVELISEHTSVRPTQKTRLKKLMFQMNACLEDNTPCQCASQGVPGHLRSTMKPLISLFKVASFDNYKDEIYSDIVYFVKSARHKCMQRHKWLGLGHFNQTDAEKLNSIFTVFQKYHDRILNEMDSKLLRDKVMALILLEWLYKNLKKLFHNDIVTLREVQQILDFSMEKVRSTMDSDVGSIPELNKLILVIPFELEQALKHFNIRAYEVAMPRDNLLVINKIRSAVKRTKEKPKLGSFWRNYETEFCDKTILEFINVLEDIFNYDCTDDLCNVKFVLSFFSISTD